MIAVIGAITVSVDVRLRPPERDAELVIRCILPCITHQLLHGVDDFDITLAAVIDCFFAYSVQHKFKSLALSGMCKLVFCH